MHLIHLVGVISAILVAAVATGSILWIPERKWEDEPAQEKNGDAAEQKDRL